MNKIVPSEVKYMALKSNRGTTGSFMTTFLAAGPNLAAAAGQWEFCQLQTQAQENYMFGSFTPLTLHHTLLTEDSK